MAASNNGGGPMDGWNDPPMLSYNPAAGSSQRTRLNKRVSYPVSPAITSSSSGSDNSSGVLLSPKDGPPKLPPVQILPPTSSTTVNPPVPLLVPNMSPPVDSCSLPPSFASAGKDPQLSGTLPELLERLNLDSADNLRKYTKRVLHETVDSLKDCIQGRSREDVQKRLGILDDQWRDDKLSDGAKVKLGCLASALVNNDLKQADALHLSLMVDHISEVSQWMVGVKRVLNELKVAKSLQQPASSEKDVSPESIQDVCIDTDKFSKTQTMLVPDFTNTDLSAGKSVEDVQTAQTSKENLSGDNSMTDNTTASSTAS